MLLLLPQFNGSWRTSDATSKSFHLILLNASSTDALTFTILIHLIRGLPKRRFFCIVAVVTFLIYLPQLSTCVQTVPFSWLLYIYIFKLLIFHTAGINFCLSNVQRPRLYTEPLFFLRTFRISPVFLLSPIIVYQVSHS